MKNFKPILFSSEMVNAILEDRKTQTRRIIFKDAPSLNKPDIICTGFTNDKKIAHFQGKKSSVSAAGENPKYQPGDILWVRETWQQVWNEEDKIPNFENRPKLPGYGTGNCHFIYRADGEIPEHPNWGDFRWKPSIFMPKEACRIFLEVTNVRVERLREISEEDVIAEGIKPIRNWHNEGKHNGWKDYTRKDELTAHFYPINSFSSLWESINGKNSWNENPWVWVYDFKRVEKPANFLTENPQPTTENN